MGELEWVLSALESGVGLARLLLEVLFVVWPFLVVGLGGVVLKRWRSAKL